MERSPILVTGATGNISSLVVQQLLASGFKVRAFVHSADKAKALSDKGVETIIGDFCCVPPDTLQ
jgi:uncharacterized protein YbjT (DUF2867 family)